MKSALFIPNFGPFGDPEVLVRLAVASESAGWEGFFMWDHINWEEEETRWIADPWIALTAIAAATSMIRFGPMITPVPRRRPWKLARETVTLDRLSGGRLNLGVGIGYPPDAEFGAFGEEGDDRERAKLLDEGLAILDGLWSGERFSYAGERLQVSDVCFQPTPLQEPRVPVWCAGWWPSPRPFRRAARWDGVFPELQGGDTPTPDDVRDILAFTAKHRTSDGPFDVVIDGCTDGESGELMADYEAAGVTWWLERITPGEYQSADEVLGRIQAGPPRPLARGAA